MFLKQTAKQQNYSKFTAKDLCREVKISWSVSHNVFGLVNKRNTPKKIYSSTISDINPYFLLPVIDSETN